jgi:hypothetical protein
MPASPRAAYRVGIGLHSITDVEEEIASLHTEMLQFGEEIARQLFGSDPQHRAFDVPLPGTPQDKIDLYHSVWRPLMNEWLAFRDVHGHSFWQNLPLSGAWDRIQEFRSRLIAVRDRARLRKINLMSPDPTPPKPDLDLSQVARVAGYTAVGVGGIVLLRTLLDRRDRRER